MTVGELDFTDFVELYKKQDPSNPFPSAAYTFLFLCLFLMSVGLMNLLVREHPFHVMIIKVSSKMYQCSQEAKTTREGALYPELCASFIRFGFYGLVICVALSLPIRIGQISKA